MFGSMVLEVAIGLIFIFLLLSLIVTALLEFIASLFQLRSGNLFKAIKQLLDDPNLGDLGEKLYNHPLVKQLSQPGRKPSYLPPDVFATTLLDVIRQHEGDTSPIGSNTLMQKAKELVASLPDGNLKTSLSLVIADTKTQADEIRAAIENWFNQSMDRVSGWYKRQTQWIGFVVAIVIAVATNVDALYLTDTLASNETLRKALVAVAEAEQGQVETFLQRLQGQVQETGQSEGDVGEAAVLQQIQQAAADLQAATTELLATAQQTGLPVGWGFSDNALELQKGQSWTTAIIGWLLTAIAISVGAPFWFNLLNQALRQTGVRPGTSTTKKPTAETESQS